jgi:lysophospholipase L1-like esterase
MQIRSLPLLATAFSVVLSCSVLAQQTVETSSAQQSLQRWRESKFPTLKDDFGELARYRDANPNLKLPAVGENRVVFFGDSITDMWKLEEYFPGKPYINRGISGQTTPQMLVRFRQDAIDLQPKVIVILAGTNDIAGNTGPMRLEDIEANYASLAELAAAHNIHVVLSSILPVHNYTPKSQDLFAQRSPEKIMELNRWLKAYCAANGHVYLDYFGAMVDDKGLLKRDLADDGLHPNVTGYKLMTPLAQAAVEKALAQSDKP